MITKNLIAGQESNQSSTTFVAIDPANKAILPGTFHIATKEEIDAAMKSAHEAWKAYSGYSGVKKAALLRQIANNIESIGDELVQRMHAESGLPEGRILGERGRTCGQLRMMADLVEEGSWVNATIDEAMPDRQPLPRVDIRKMLLSIGPVAVFGSSNFPLAYSTAGGDTASALAAGCPVIVKGHPMHPGTNALVAEAVNNAIKTLDMPAGLFSMINGGIEEGQYLVKHPLLAAVGFTGSIKGGRSLMDAAASRANPIPVYAEMGSTNPLFLLPSALDGDLDALANTIAGSVNLGAGQFCTKPGFIVVPPHNRMNEWEAALIKAFDNQVPSTMLGEQIYKNYKAGIERNKNEIDVVDTYPTKSENNDWKAYPTMHTVNASTFITNPSLHHEVFGAYTMVIKCEHSTEMLQIANQLEGQLTGSIMGSEVDCLAHQSLCDAISRRVGRLIYNGVPTGVEVCSAMNHGGPYPSASTPLFSAVGKDAIYRWVRPLSFQSTPNSLLPDALKDENPLGINRLVNGKWL